MEQFVHLFHQSGLVPSTYSSKINPSFAANFRLGLHLSVIRNCFSGPRLERFMTGTRPSLGQSRKSDLSAYSIQDTSAIPNTTNI
jgi:hypothetical protein